MATKGGRIDFMFLGPPLTRPLDPLLRSHKGCSLVKYLLIELVFQVRQLIVIRIWQALRSYMYHIRTPCDDYICLDKPVITLKISCQDLCIQINDTTENRLMTCPNIMDIYKPVGRRVAKFMSKQLLCLQWRIKDFPNGAPTPVFGAKAYYLARFLPKTAWKWKKLDREV